MSRQQFLLIFPMVFLADGIACLMLGKAARDGTSIVGATRARMLALLFGVVIVNALLAFTLCTSVAFADPVVADQKVESPDRLTVGDRLRVIVKLTAEPGTTVTLAPGSLADPFLLTKQPSTSINGRDVTVTLDMAVFATGDLQIPSLRLAFKERNGNAGEVVTRPTSIKVESVLPEDTSNAQLRPLKPQAEIPEPGAFEALVPVGVALALVLVALIAFVVLRRRSKPRQTTIEVEDESFEAAEDRARGALDNASAAFTQDADYVAYYTTLANTLREYLTARFGFPAFALTTTEMQDQMVRRGMDRWQARIVGGLLNQCDAVVYARYRPAPERADIDLTAAYEIVEMSRPGELTPEHEAVPMRLADPIALALLVAIPVLLFLRARLQRGGSGGYSDLGLLAGMRPTWRVRFRWLPTAFSAIALALLVVALARPQKGQAETQLPGQGIDIVLVLDTSSSMSGSMGKASRLETSQKVLQDFIKGRKEDRVGLVIFRESSVVLSPMTLDYEALGDLVGRVNDVNLPDGTAIGVGLSDALNLLRDSKARSRVVVLLTDGENNSGNIEPLTASRLAQTLGIRLYTIGAVDSKTRRGGTQNVDEKALTEMAKVTGGQYYAADSQETLDEVYKNIDTLEKSRVGRTQFGAYDEYAVYLLVAALAMLGLELGLRSTLWRQAT